MSNNKDNVSLLYNGLIKKGYTQEDLGDESTFREKMSDENNRRELYDYVSGRGDFRIGDYDTYLSRLNEAYANTQSDDDAVFEANAERFRNGQPTERVTTQSMIDAHPELGFGEKSYQYKPEVQQHIIDNKPDMFKPKTVDMYGAHSKDKTEMDLLQEGRLYDLKEARQNWLKRPVTSFGEAFEQGTDALYQGGKNLVGETANIVTGSQRDYQRAKTQLDELVASGYDLSNFDAEQALKAYKDRDYQRKMNEWQRNIASRKAERKDMGFFESLLHKMQDPSRPKSQYEETGLFADELQLSRSYQAIQDALQKSNGNVQEAYKLLGQKASEETWGDETTREARQALASQRPTEGFGAWVGGMIPQMIGTGAGIVASLNPYTRWLARPLGLTNMAFLTGATSGMSMAEARKYAEEKGLPINEGDIWRTGLVDAAIEYGTERIPFNRYFGRIQDVTKKIIGKGVADATLNNDAVKNEVSDLLQRASKEFRNGLFTKENIKEYLKDVGTEGVSEFMAEALQTLSPVIYQNPEDYPTLVEVLNSGLEGAKGGLFMGVFLGGGSLYSANRMQNYANRKRREKQGSVSFVETDKGIFEILGYNDGVYSVMDSNGEQSEVTADQVRDQVSVSLEEFDDSMNEARESHIQDVVDEENAQIDAATDPQTGLYGEVTMIIHDENGEQVDVTVNVYGEKVVNGKLYLLVEKDGQKEYIRPMQYYPETYQKRPAEEVKALNEEMIREEAAQQAENEARWNPNVPEPQEGISFFNGDEEVTIVGTDGNGGLFVAPSEEYRAAQGNEKKVAEVVNRAMQLGAIPIEQYKDAMTRQIEEQEVAQAQEEEAAANTQAVVDNMPRKTDETGRIFVPKSVQGDEVAYDITDAQGNVLEQGTSKVSQFAQLQDYVAPVEEQLNDDGTSVSASGEAVGEQVNAGVNAEVNNPVVQEETSGAVEAQQEPTLESVIAALPKTKKGEIDYEAMTPQQQYQYTSLSESPEVALEDLQADIAANEEELVKMKDELGKARGGKRAELRDKVKKLASANEELKAFYESVAPKQEPIAETENTESADPIKYAAEEVAEEPKPIVAETEKPKKSRKPKLTGRKKPQKPSEFTDEELRPVNGVELAAEQLAAGNIKITVESYKKETGHGEEERKKLGLTPFRSTEKGGMTIEQAAEKLVEEDNANHNGRMFDGDTMAARDAIIELLGMSEKWGDVTNYIKNNRMVERQKREEAEYAEYEAYLMESLHVTPEELELLNEAEEQRIIELNKVVNEVDAIFAEAELERQNNEEYEQGRIVEGSQGQSELLSEARAGDLGGNQRNESERGTGEVVGTSDNNSETSQESASGSEVAPSIEETNVGRMADIEARILEIEGRRNEISDEIADTPSYDLLKIGELRAEEWELEQEQAELEAEYSGLRSMNDESNAISEAEGSGLRFRESAKEEENRRKPLRERAKQWGDKLGVKVRIMESLGDVVNPYARRAIASGQVVTGWFEESTGEVCIYMPHVNSESEVDATYIHEVVAHKGLRGLLGEKFDSFCDEVWDMMSDADRLKFMSYPGVSHLEGKEKSRAAADEYIAHLAENVDVTESAWSKFAELIKRFFKAIGIEPKMTNADIANTIKKSYQRLLSGENAEGNVSGNGIRFNAKRVSDRRQDKNRVNNTVDQAVAFVMGKGVKEVKAERIEREQKRKEDAAEIYQSVLSGDFNDVTLQKINDYIDDATPLHPYGRRISQRLPQKLERSLHEGSRTNAVDALFSRICESSVPASRRTSEAGRREIEERKKEALKGWAIATNNWHTDLSEFTDEQTPFAKGTDSEVFLSKDGKYVIKTSFGKPEGKRFRPDIDNIPLFNSVFRNSAYEIVGYGEFDGKFARILKQPFVEFAEDSKVSVDERVDYMHTLGLEPINEAKTAFSNGTIIVADLQKSNIVKTAQGNIRVIDADVKLHTKDVGGNYTYPPVEADLPEGTRFRFIGERGARNLDKAEEATTRLDNLSVAREMETAFNAKKARIEKLKDSKPIEITGNEISFSDDLKQYKKNALEYGKTFRGNYTNKDTGESVFIGKNGLKEVLNHDYKNVEQLQSVAAIPSIIENSIYIESRKNNDNKVDAEKFDYYVCGLKIDGEDYTVRAVFVTPKDGTRYYDHKLTKIEKGNLLDSLVGTTPGFNQTDSLNSENKDTVLISILQTNDKENAKKIKMATGWERGADGKWRYEVDDNIDFELRRPRKAELKKAYDEANEKYYKLEMRVPVRTPKNATEEEKQRIKDLRKELAKLRKAMNKAFEAYYDYSADNAKLGDFLGKDNQLFKEYPELADYDISFLRDTSKLSQGLKGSFTPEYETIWIDDARPNGDIKSSLIHEIQHAIQGIEGFAQGGTPQMFAVSKYHAEDSKANFKEFINRYGFEDWEKNLPFEDLMAYGKQYKGEFGALHRAFIENAVEDESVKKTLLNELDYVKDTYNKFYQIAGGMDAAYKFKDANEWYRSLSGEVEARNVQQRMGMTDKQRRDTLASETEDVAREDQIFLQNAMEEGQTMFRISDKGRKIQNEVDKFTAKYNSKDVVVAEVSSMSDEEIEEMFDAPADEVREAMGKNLVGGYDKLSGKIFIFVDNQDLDDLEDTMYHENMHGFFHGNKMIGAFDEAVKDNTKNLRANLKGRGYSEEEIPEEVFVIIVTDALKKQDFKNIDKYLPEEYKEDFYNKLTDFGYETGKRVSGQRSDGRGNDSENGPNGEEPRSLAETDGTQGTKRTSPREQAERLGNLFGQVADMGLDGVLGNKEYTRLMVDIYKELPEDVRTSLADDALRHYGGSIAPAVSDYVNKKGKANLWDKIAGFIREALRKVGMDVNLNANDAKYILWRSRKPLNRVNLLDIAEDIDMRYRLKVGEYSLTDGGDTPGDGGTRFKVKGKAKTKAELKEEVSDLKEEVKDLKSELKDLKKQVDSLRSGNKDEWEKKQRAIVSFIKGRLTKEAGSVLGKTRLDQLLTLVNKASTSTDLRKPLQFIEQVINDASIEHAASKMDKLIKTKLQGETNRGVAKGVVVDESTRRLFDSIRGTFKDLIATSIDSELRSVRGEILRFGKERNALPEDDLQGRAILQARQDALKQRKEELEKEQEELQRQNVNETKESLERRHDELVEAMDAHIEGNGVWTQEMQDEYDSIPLRLKLAEIRESQSQLDSILVDSLMTRRNAYKTTGAERKKLLAEADVLESNYTIAQEELIRLMNEVSSELSSIINEGKSRLATRRQALAERRRHIVTMGISAVKDKKIKEQNSILTRKEKFDKWFDNSWLKNVSDFMTAPLNSFNFMLKYIDRNHTIGEGELYKHFMKSEEGALEANNRLYDGLKAYNTAIEEKAKEIFGKDIEKVMKDSGEQHVGKVHKQYLYDSSDHKEGDMYPISISKGQAFYVWLTWRQEDGRAKLIADGWNDQSIEEIESLIGEDYMKFGEWITDDFFPNLREEKYNKTHIEMFGTSMAKREHYFPFKISSSDIQEKGEMGESYEGMPSTITGNIIKRTINKSRINTEQNAFDLLYKYGNDMETWNAMAKLRQDLNFLHASKAFRNYLEANSKGLFDKFMKAAEVAVKAYNNSGESNAINDFLVKINRMWAGSNIGFRLNTAMKQILSYPAFMAYSANPKYLGNLAKYMMNWKGNYDWAKENLPAFGQRIETGDLGMTGMSDPQFDLGKHIKKFTDAGMIPNQLVDALTCAAGARSVYEFEYDKAIKNGLTEEEAKNIAQYNAEVAFNETQQSSREEFVSPIQMSRNVLLKSMMNYQNSNVGYQRLGNEGLLEIMRAKHVYEQDIKNGMSKEEAQAKLRKSIVRGSRKMMVAFTILPGLWYLGSQGIVGITSPVISSLFGGGGDDEPYLDEEAKTELLWSMALGTVAGTTLGQTIASIAQGREYNPMVWMNEMQKDINDAVKNGWNLNTTKNIALRLAKFGGVNVETWENIYLGVEHAIRTGNPDLVDFMMLINLPASQRKAMAEELYSNMPFMEYAEKVARAHKLYDDYRKNLPYAKSDKNGSKKNAIKKQYVIENLSEEKQEDYEKEKEYKKLKREYGQAENKDEWLEEHPEYKELEKEYKSQTVTKEVNREVKKLK